MGTVGEANPMYYVFVVGREFAECSVCVVRRKTAAPPENSVINLNESNDLFSARGSDESPTLSLSWEDVFLKN